MNLKVSVQLRAWIYLQTVQNGIKGDEYGKRCLVDTIPATDHRQDWPCSRKTNTKMCLCERGFQSTDGQFQGKVDQNLPAPVCGVRIAN